MKFKNIPESYIKVILDRLFHLKPAYERYERVFSDILNKFLIKENTDEEDISHLDIDKKIALAAQIFNQSVKSSADSGDNFLNDYIIKRRGKTVLHKPALKKIPLCSSES